MPAIEFLVKNFVANLFEVLPHFFVVVTVGKQIDGRFPLQVF
jgi:hypothetical protein